MSVDAAYTNTREALHRLAVYVISPAREAVDGRISLESTPGGFGTPEFGETRRRIRVEGVELVDASAGEERHRARITTIAAAAAAVGMAPAIEKADAFDVPPPGDLDAPLDVDPAAAARLASTFALAFTALGAFSGEAGDQPSEPRLWPEHFDAAIDAGDADADLRATFGVSPGDRHRSVAYAYASPWLGVTDDPFWNAEGFSGAWIAVEGASVDDIVAFWRAARARIRGR